MLKTPEHFCEYITGCIRIYRQVMPKMLEYTIHVPYEYIKDTEYFLTDHNEFRRRVDKQLQMIMGSDNFIIFKMETDGGLTAKINHTEDAPITSWPFSQGTYLIDKLLAFHQATIGPRVIVRISQYNLLSNENIMEAYRTFRLRFSDDLEFRINKDYFEARTL